MSPTKRSPSEPTWNQVKVLLEALDKKLTIVAEGVVDLQVRGGRIEERLSSLESRVGLLETAVLALDARVGRLETTVVALTTGIQTFTNRLTTVEAKVSS